MRILESFLYIPDILIIIIVIVNYRMDCCLVLFSLFLVIDIYFRCGPSMFYYCYNIANLEIHRFTEVSDED